MWAVGATCYTDIHLRSFHRRNPAGADCDCTEFDCDRRGCADEAGSCPGPPARWLECPRPGSEKGGAGSDTYRGRVRWTPSGVFTVTEAASVAAVLAFLFALVRGRMSWADFLKGLREATSATAMLYVILIGAFVFTYFITAARIPEALVQVIQGLPVPPLVIVSLILLAYLVLGAVFDEISAMLITLPFIPPVIVKLGYSPLWWGILNVVVIELGMIIPPIGVIVFLLTDCRNIRYGRSTAA